MSKSVVTAASAGRAKTLSRAKVLREKENNHKPAAEEAAAAHQHDAQATELAPTHNGDAPMSGIAMSDTISLAGDFSFSGVMADAAASADFMASSAGFAGMSGFADDSNGGGGFMGGGSAPLIVGGLVAAGVVVAVAASGGDDKTPANAVPVATAGKGAGLEDAVITAKATATDADNNTLTWALKTGSTAPAGVTVGTDGTVTLDAKNAAYQSLAAGKTQDVVTNVTVSDGKGGSADTTVTITVTGVNDAPTVAATQAIKLDENTKTTLTVAGSDVDTGDTLTYTAGTAANGTITAGSKAGDFTYTPKANFDGTDSFTVTVKDAAGASATQTVNVTVNNVGPTNAAVTLGTANAGQSVTDADNVNTTYTVGAGNYNYTINGFDAGGDKLVGPAGVTPTVINSNFADGQVTVQWAIDGSNIVQVTLAGLTNAQDGAIIGLTSLNTTLGAGTVA